VGLTADVFVVRGDTLRTNCTLLEADLRASPDERALP
jgi:hypothetical protein